MRNINIIILFLLTTMFMGCTERLDGLHDDTLTDSNLSVNLGTRATLPIKPEEAIYSARLIVIGTAKGNENYQKVTCNQYFSATDIKEDRVLRVKTRTGVSDIYLIVNEERRNFPTSGLPADATADDLAAERAFRATMDGIKTLDDLQKVQMMFPSKPEIEKKYIPMMRCFRGIDIKADLKTQVGGNVAGSQVEHMWAKLRVRFKSRDADPANGKFDYTGSVINSVELRRIPKYVRLNEKQHYNDKDALTPVDKLITKSYTLKKDIAGSEAYVFYVPENILTDTTRSSYLVVSGTIQNIPRTFRIYLGNNVAAGDFNVDRNKFYDYTGTVCSIGEGMIIQTKVTPWDEKPIAADVANFIKASIDELILLDGENMQRSDIMLSTVSHNIAGTHTNAVTTGGYGLTLQGSDAANMPTSADYAVVQKDIIVNISDDFISGTVKIDLGGSYHKNIKISRETYATKFDVWERHRIGSEFVYISPTSNNELMRVSKSSSEVPTTSISGVVSPLDDVFVYIKRSITQTVFSARRRDGLNIPTEVFIVSPPLGIGNVFIARRDLVGKKTWNEAMTGATGCRTLGKGW
ncbi:MAG: hypothetical protein RR388_08265, partial [Rikenellaceae bacterium]